MLTFKHSKGRFSCRAVGVIIDRQRLLIHHDERDDFWALPGGRVEFGESARDALAREMSEELSVTAEVGRLIWVVENFFTYRDEQFHEISFYFDVSLPDDAPLKSQNEPFAAEDDGVPLIFEWYPIERLEDVVLYPTFLRKAIACMPPDTQYIVHRDDG
ncbi:MAG TPA: NUDIX hydrolase [Pyrinomonadaceae bacterium]|jgi:ADP-ribose pyrophosphatase YjhB (NUDIX family)